MSLHPLREPHDFYPTPPEATRALLSVEQFSGPIWEPACGDGAIAKELFAAGYHVVSTDLVDRGYGLAGIDFLQEPTARARNIITNPPYGSGLPNRFIHHALALTRSLNGSVAMLLDLAGLAHPTRTGFYTRNPPAAVYLLDELVCWPRNRVGAFPAANRFAWLVWRPNHQGRPSLWWLSPSTFKTVSEGWP